jgi:5-epi-alpha-selinene synthase
MTLSVALVEMPFPYRKNPWYAGLARAMNDEMIARGLIRPDQREYHDGFNLLNAFFFPTAPPATLRTAARIIDFFFLCDDVYDTTGDNGRDLPMIGDMLRANVEVLRQRRLPPRPDALNRLALDTVEELAGTMGEAQLARLVESIADYLLGGSLVLMELWARGEVPDPETYARIRRSDVAMYPTIDVSEFVGGLALPAEVFGHPELRALREACCLQVALANDLLSYQKEVVRDRCPYNMVAVTAIHEELPLEEAVLAVIERVNGSLRRFLELEARLPSWGEAADRDVQVYVRGMKDLMAGNWYWSFESTRYSSADSPFAELRTTSALLGDKSRGHLVSEIPRARRQAVSR